MNVASVAGLLEVIENLTGLSFFLSLNFENLKIIAFEKRVDWKDATKASGIVKITGVAGTVINIGDLVITHNNKFQEESLYCQNIGLLVAD